jgi:hypothetical protein
MPSFPRFFRNASIEEPLFFDEGPRVPEARIAPRPGVFMNTSSMDTSGVDAFRQGVELTQQKHFDKGIVKIHAGEPGHVVRRNHFGLNKNYRAGPTFEELELFNPVTFIRAQEILEPLYFNILTFPIITGDNNQLENFDFDGVIEPMPIREIASFFSIEVPFAARSVKASMMAGNMDSSSGTDQVKTVDEFSERFNQGFLDLIEMFGMFSTVGFFLHEKSPLKPFLDRRLPGNFTPLATTGASIQTALSQMSPATENYVNEDEHSGACGWDYDNTSQGTDSLNFGGMTY